jgi:hypothetical protein
MIRRAQLCIDAGGNHFQHLLLWYILSEFGYCIDFCIYTTDPGYIFVAHPTQHFGNHLPTQMQRKPKSCFNFIQNKLPTFLYFSQVNL